MKPSRCNKSQPILLRKQELRASFREKRRLLSQEERADAAQQAAKQFANRFEDILKKHSHAAIALYTAIDGEISCNDISEWARQHGVHCYFPRVDGDTVLFPVELAQLEMIIVPGIVFDRRGYRIGFGKGYYDRLLKNYGGVKVGLAYEMQVVEHIPEDPWDIPMDVIVTNQTTLFLNGKG